MRRTIGYAAAWLVAVVLAVTVGIVAVTTVGASVRGRGPLGDTVIRTDDLERSPEADPSSVPVDKTFRGDYGRFDVRCEGVSARGTKAVAATGWRVVSYEPGPDDDVDAVFTDGRRSVDLEVFCNAGRPTVAEIERNQLPDDD